MVDEMSWGTVGLCWLFLLIGFLMGSWWGGRKKPIEELKDELELGEIGEWE